LVKSTLVLKELTHGSASQLGVNNLVVDSSSIEVNRRFRRAMADNLDAVRLVGLLIRYCEGDAKAWSVVTVPGADDEDHRQPHRELNQLRRERTTHTNRIRGLLATVGIKITAQCLLLPGDLDSWRQWNCEPLGEHLKRRLLCEFGGNGGKTRITKPARPAGAGSIDADHQLVPVTILPDTLSSMPAS
jgi:transposase